ncbi:TonB-dependent receptor [Mucilaginibacter sp. UR6-11]|uniref:TonB-dependent receptor n=1 Tax=Mucilaginibacter sp. UR6-11 TaxID=1435644 RepID=UPI001E3180E5|nr:TonB-dependent receptor [Mucilaginibacter sp. UR6-11]MCC8425053.1 TonB-dependent receptor [Mucilaginibacter sp. UR6-11]
MKHNYLLLKLLSLFLCCLFWSFSTFAQTIRGKVFDSKTGEPLVGATVKIERGSFKQATSAKLDGSYSFKNLQPGTYKIDAKFIGYNESKDDVVNINEGATVTQNILLQDANTQVNEVVIAGSANKATDRSARTLERNANSVINILSQNTIQLLPDVTVGNAIQRVSGVSIQRTSTGEGRYAIIRGMDQRYNNTLVNGIKIPSPDDRYRFVPMDIFPSEMLERLEVVKALTPNMEGDAIGGSMNLVMKSAPDRFIFDANLSGGFSTLFSSSRPFTSFSSSGINKNSPAQINGNDYAATFKDFNSSAITSNKQLSNPVSSTAGFTIGDRFLDKKLGVILSASYQNIYRGSNSKELTPNAAPTIVPAPNSPQFSDSYDRTYSTQTQRVGLHTKIDYIFDKNNKISLYNLYLHTNEYQSRQTSDTLGLGLNSTGLSKQITISNRSTFTQQTVYNATLQGNHRLADKLDFDWDGVYSIAKRNQPDRTDFSYDANNAVNSAGEVTASVKNNMALSHHWENNTDKDIAGYGNLKYSPKIGNTDVEFALGGLYRHKTRDAYYATYDLTGGKATLYNNNFDAVPFYFNLPSDGIGNNNKDKSNNYAFKEDINAEYVQAKFKLFDRLQVLGGVRIENTLQSYNTEQPLTYSQKNGTISYTDVLPSLHLNYSLSDLQNLRLSYYAAISRPGFGEIVPYNIDGEYYKQIGNPNLKHSTSNNYDLRYELFPGGADQLLLGSFYKNIQDPIEYFVVTNGGPSALFVQPGNAQGGATNYGFEALVTKYFGVFGVSANYTYTHSSITTDKLLKIDNSPIVVQQTRSLQGQAASVANASFLFKSQKLGLDMQLAYVYTGERIAQVSTYYNLDFYYHPFSQLDFSFEKKIVNRLSFYGKVNNLTNTANKIYLKYPHADIDSKQQEFLGKQDISGQTLVQSDYYKVSFLGGFRYKF